MKLINHPHNERTEARRLEMNEWLEDAGCRIVIIEPERLTVAIKVGCIPTVYRAADLIGLVGVHSGFFPLCSDTPEPEYIHGPDGARKWYYATFALLSPADQARRVSDELKRIGIPESWANDLESDWLDDADLLHCPLYQQVFAALELYGQSVE
jgi:hypothetical protein